MLIQETHKDVPTQAGGNMSKLSLLNFLFHVSIDLYKTRMEESKDKVTFFSPN